MSNSPETSHGVIKPSEIRPGTVVHSSNGAFHLHFQTDGNLVLYLSTFDNKLVPYWHTSRHGTRPVKWAMQGDGNFVYYGEVNGQNIALWNTGTHGNPGAWLHVQDDGNLVIYSQNNRPLWATRTVYSVKRWNQLSVSQQASLRSQVRGELARRTAGNAQKQNEALNYAEQQFARMEATNEVVVSIPGGTAEVLILYAVLLEIGLVSEAKSIIGNLIEDIRDVIDDLFDW